ncbi:MAG: hypothetical protein KF809_14825 [Chloroflexi bacterium]|nr:hypothetical protein [Chloroflexota bacterium]
MTAAANRKAIHEATRTILGPIPESDGRYRAELLTLESAINESVSEAARMVWSEWPCDSEDCPARPSWEPDLWTTRTALERELLEDVTALIRDRIEAVFIAFGETHPRATLRGSA